MTKHTLYVDSAEKRSGIATKLTSLGHTVRSKRLATGDYSLPGKFIIERKEVNDFTTSIMNGRLFNQAESLASHADRPIILLEGNLEEVYSSIDSEAVAGAISALLIVYDISVVSTYDRDASANLIGRMVVHATKGLGYEIPMRKDKPKFDSASALYLVEGLPGVGPDLARNLICHFGTPAKVFAATAGDLRKVRGVGPKTVAAIQGVLHSTPNGFRSTKTAP